MELRIGSLSLRTAAAMLGLMAASAVQAQSSGLSQEYCSTENTGASYQGVYNMYQSNGACETQCQGNWAFAVVQDTICWCSNYIPATTVDVSQCNENCPGYPSDLCGSLSSGLYGYIPLSKTPLGVYGAARSSVASSVSIPQDASPSCRTSLPSEQEAKIFLRDFGDGDTTTSSSSQQFTRTFFTRSTTTTFSSSSSSSSILTNSLQASPSSTLQSSSSQLQTGVVSKTVIQTVTQNGGATTVVSYVTIPASSSTSSSSPTSTPLATSFSSTASSISMSTQVVTVSGAVITRTVTATPVSSSASQDGTVFQQTQQQNGISGGAIAGIVIGVVAALALIALGAFLVYRRRRQREQEAAVAAASAGINEKPKPPPKRNISVLSKAGLLGTGASTIDHTDNSNPFDEPANAGTASQRHSMLFGAGGFGAEGVSPVSPLETTQTNDSRRNSRPMVYDQRLNPSALFASHDNGSRVSMQDGADYSRTLGVRNPDPRTSWESRVSRA